MGRLGERVDRARPADRGCNDLVPSQADAGRRIRPCRRIRRRFMWPSTTSIPCGGQMRAAKRLRASSSKASTEGFSSRPAASSATFRGINFSTSSWHPARRRRTFVIVTARRRGVAKPVTLVCSRSFGIADVQAAIPSAERSPSVLQRLRRQFLGEELDQQEWPSASCAPPAGVPGASIGKPSASRAST